MDISLPDSFLTDVLGVLLRVGVAVLIVLAGRWLARRSRIWLAEIMERATLTPSMESLFLSVAYYSVWIATIMAALIVLGVPAAAVLTVVGVALLLLAADPRVLPEPPAAVLVTDLRETGVNLSVRAAVASADYWSLQNDLRERIKARFDEEGITIPSLQGAMTAIQQV